MSVKIFTKKITSWESLPVLLDIETVCCLLQVSENPAIKLCKNGEIKGKKLGGMWRVSRDSLRDFFTN